MPTFVAQPKKSKGRSGRLWENNRRKCLQLSQICWICAGECPDFSWEKLPFNTSAIDMSIKWPDPASASVDHVIPLDDLLADDPRCWQLENLRPAHLRCNSARGNGKRKTKDRVTLKTSRNWLA